MKGMKENDYLGDWQKDDVIEPKMEHKGALISFFFHFRRSPRNTRARSPVT
jgi:hypothetical protein